MHGTCLIKHFIIFEPITPTVGKEIKLIHKQLSQVMKMDTICIRDIIITVVLIFVLIKFNSFANPFVQTDPRKLISSYVCTRKHPLIISKPQLETKHSLSGNIPTSSTQSIYCEEYKFIRKLSPPSNDRPQVRFSLIDFYVSLFPPQNQI